MTREQFRLAITIILIGFLWLYHKDVKKDNFPKFLPATNYYGVINTRTGEIYTKEGVYFPQYWKLYFTNKEIHDEYVKRELRDIKSYTEKLSIEKKALESLNEARKNEPEELENKGIDDY